MRSIMRICPMGRRGVLTPNSSPSPQAISSSREKEFCRAGTPNWLDAWRGVFMRRLDFASWLATLIWIRRACALLQQIPHRIGALHDLGAHLDRPSPGAAGFCRPFVSGVDAELRTETGDRTREVEVIDGSATHQVRIARRIDARCDGPDDFLPVAHVDVFVGHDHELEIGRAHV